MPPREEEDLRLKVASESVNSKGRSYETMKKVSRNIFHYANFLVFLDQFLSVMAVDE